MSLSAINTNIIALQTQNNLNNSQLSLSTSIQRLSSGLKINTAADDPAGLAIASRMSSQLSGINQASQNASTGISMLQTADGGLASTSQLLQNMRSLAVQAANGTNSTSDLSSLQATITQLQAQIQQVSTTTQYNGINLLDGSLANVQFQVGANAGQTINFGVASAQQTALGNNEVKLSGAAGNTVGSAITEAGVVGSATTGANNVAAQTITIQGNGVSKTVGVALADSAAAIAAKINLETASTGVAAKASTTAKLSFANIGAQNFTINGIPISGNSAATNFDDLTQRINAQAGTTGVSAVATSDGIVLSNSTGADIKVANTSASANSVSLAGTTNSGAFGTAVTLLSAGSGTNTASVGGNISFSSPNGFAVTTDTASAGLFGSTSANGSVLSAVSSINLSTVSASGIPTGANSALSIIDAAIAQVNNSRGLLGALQNRFTATVSNLQTASLNLTSSRSTVQDANFATETTNLSRSQILQQAGTAMLAQANSLPNGVLALLR